MQTQQNSSAARQHWNGVQFSGLTFALFTRHVIAASILLDGGIAFGAFLGIGHQPVRRLGIIGALLLPELDIFAN